MDENSAGAVITAVTTENATSVTVDNVHFEVADGNLKLKADSSLDFEAVEGGMLDVTITASGDGESDTHTVTITVNDVNEPTTIDVRDNETVPQKGVNTSLTIDENTVHDGDGGAPLALIEIMDHDAGDPVTGDAAVGRVSLSGAMADYFQVILDPEDGLWLAMKDGATFDYETVGGEVMVTVTYTDQDGGTVSADVTVTVNDVNEAPEVADGAEVADMVFEGGEENSITVDLKALFSDPDGDLLTYRLSDNAPEWLEMSVVTKGSGADQTITGTITGTAPDRDGTLEGVMIVASDTEHEAHASFDVIVDAANDAPSRLELRVTEDDGFVVRTTEVNVGENAMGAVLGLLKVTDEDDPRHPHGQHEYSFMVDGEASDKFEVDMDGNLKLKDDMYLNHEDGDEITLTVTATDMSVGEDESNQESISLEITINVGDVPAADRPVANRDIGDWWVTVDDDLDAEDVYEGEWLSFGLDTTGSDAAFSHEDGDDLTYSVSVVDSDGGVVNWLQISEDGKMTNKEGMLPERGVYMVTVTATDEDGDSAQTSFHLAVALSDAHDDDNDGPDIRDVDDFDYTEGSGSQKVASFSVRDDDVAIAPHPYGVLNVDIKSATQEGGRNVKDLLKVVEVGRDEDSVHYEIHTKSAAELAVGKDGKALDTPIKPLDFEQGDEVDITVMVTDGGSGTYPKDGGILPANREGDEKDITFDIVDAADTAPAFDPTAVRGGDGGMRSKKTTTITVDQDEPVEVIVVQLSEAWKDEDSDDDELDFGPVGGKSDLPDWITVYGPDEWERIYDRRDNDHVDESHADDDVRDGDQVVVIVINREATDDMETHSFTLVAKDDEGNSTTETISIKVKDTNVGITPDPKNPVVSIVGDPEGIAPLSIGFDASQDPDIAGGTHPVLVVYTWSHDNATPGDVTDDPIVSVSSTPQELVLDADRDRTNDYVGRKVTAKVEYYEIDPQTGAVADVQTYMDVSDTIEAQDPPDPVTSVSMDLVTSDGGVTAAITATGAAREAGTARLEASANGESGWITVDTTEADTTGTPGEPTGLAGAELDVDENADAREGDGGGLYYRVIYTYTDEDDDTQTAMSEVIQLGDVEDPIAGATTNILGGDADTPINTGGSVRIDNQGNDVEVQWQMLSSRPGSSWTDLDGETGLELDVTSAHAGNSLRAKVTYTADDDATTTDVDEEGWVEWVEYTEILTVSGATADTDPATVQANHVLRVELDQKSSAPGAVQKAKVATFDASSLFFDADGDDLTYTISSATSPTPDLDSPATSADAKGTAADLGAGGSVYRVYTSEWNETDSAAETTDNVEQSFSIDKDTGMVTYITDRSHGHDGTGGEDNDGTGNRLTFTISAMDAVGTPAEATVMVRVNVAPTAIKLSDGTAAVENLRMPAEDETGTALTDAGGDVTYMDDEQNAAAEVATIDVMDENLRTDKFGTHKVTLSGRGADQFEVVETTDGDTDGSTWEIRLKDDAVFDFEALATKAEKDAKEESITLSITVTATDGGGLVTQGVFSVKVMDDETDDDPKTVTPPADDPDDPEVPGLEDDAKRDEDDNDGPVIPPDDGGAFVGDLGGLHVADDLLDSFVLAIDDIDVA